MLGSPRMDPTGGWGHLLSQPGPVGTVVPRQCCVVLCWVLPQGVSALLPCPVPPQSVNIVPLTPMSLVPPEDVEKKDNPLFR